MSKYIITICICLGFFAQVHAKHIIGGDVFYTCLSIDTINNKVNLHFEFQMYRDGRDATGADFDGGPNSTMGAEFGVFRRVGGNWAYVKKTAPLTYRIRERVEPNTQPCLITPPAIFVERAVYEFDMELDIIDQDYMIAYQRCCRSESISNLNSPGDFGAVFAIEITPASLMACNNSPIFNEFPPLIICAGFELEYDHSARDAEGDQIVYEFCTPLSGGGNPGPGANNVPRSDCRNSVFPDPAFCGPDNFRNVSFRAPTFTARAPMAGNPAVNIDASTGMITGIPEITGEHVMAVCAKEYRDGVLMSTIRRDFQFIVSSCEKAVDAIIASDRTISDNEFEVISCGDFNVNFRNLSVRDQDIKEFRWEFDLKNRIEISERKNPSFTFPDFGIYDVKMILNPGIANCTDSAFITVKVFPGLEADYEFSYDTCVAGPVSFQDLSFTDAQFLVRRTWDFGDGNGSNQINPRYQYGAPGFKNVSLEVEDNNGCIDEITQNFDYSPAPSIIIVEPSSFLGCEPAEVFFNNLTEPIDERYKISWDFGDGSDSEEKNKISPTHIYEQEGVYTVRINVTSPLGCTAQRTFPNLIRVQQGPDADFAFNPSEPSLIENTVQFTNFTTGAIAYYWDFNGEGLSFELNPSYTFRDTGIHYITLQATSANGCIDTITKVIDIVPIADLFYPNAFTPDGDGRNDVFRGAGLTELVNDFEIIIFDRWGKQVFISNDPTEGWNGRFNNTGADMPVGVYMYLVKFREPRGESKESRGFATLIR